MADDSEDAPSHVGRDAVWSTVGILMSGGAQFLLSAIVGNAGGPALLGAVRGALSLANTASLAWPSAAGQSASLFVARERSAGREASADFAERHLVVRAMQAALVLAPMSGAVSVVLFGFGLADAAWVGALVLALAGYQVARGVRFGRSRVREATVWEVVNAALTLGLLGVVLVVGAPGWVLAPLIVGNGLYALGVLVRLPRSGDREPALAREMDQFVAWGVAGTIASTGLMQLSMVLTKAVLGDDQAGWYAAAVSLATPLSMVARALSMALFPEMARQQGRGDAEATRAITDRATRGLFFVMTPGFAALALVAEPLVHLIYRDAFAPAVLPLRILLLAVWLGTVVTAAVNSINVRGRGGVRFSAGLSWAGFVVGLGLMAVLLPVWGVAGVAIAYLAGVATTGGTALVHVWRRDGHAWLFAVAVSLIAGGAVAAAVVTLPALSSWTWSLVAVAVLCVVWVAAWALLRPRERR